MKKIYLISMLVLFSIVSRAQVVIADPALSQLLFKGSIIDTITDPLKIPLNGVVKLKLPVYDRDTVNALPPGACKIKIGLGSKIKPEAGFNFNNALPGNYFAWTVEYSSGQYQITGDLIAALPAGFSDTAVFNVEGNVLGNSTITSNFLVTNHNTTVLLSDEEPNNNTSFLQYTVVEYAGGPTPVTFRSISANRIGCAINVTFTAEREINVRRYDIEYSKDGITYTKIAEVTAANLLHYTSSFPITTSNRATTIFVRVKSVDQDGRYQYTETKAVSGTCEKAPSLIDVFPNPVHLTEAINVHLNSGVLNGNYLYNIFDAAGKLIDKKTILLNNASQFNIKLPNISAGRYIIQLLKADGTQSFVAKFQKM